MSGFNFKSAICTSREQSEKLLALGLKKETADCYLVVEKEEVTVVAKPYYEIIKDLNSLPFDAEIIPAWSLDRLMEVVPHRYGEYCDYANYFMYYYIIPFDVMEQFRGETRYEYLIDCIEWLIKQGYFNKEYLV